MNSPLHVMLVDDDQFTRTMLRALLVTLGYESVSEAASATQALQGIDTSTVDVALLDLDLGEGPTGIDVAHALRRRHRDIAIVMLSTYKEPRFLGQGQLQLPNGAVYLVKDSLSDSSVLQDAIALAVAADESADDAAIDLTTKSPLNSLSDQHIEVMRAIAAGLSNAEIAKRLWVTEPAVEKSIARIIKLLDIKADKSQNQRVMIAQIYFKMTGAVSVRPK